MRTLSSGELALVPGGTSNGPVDGVVHPAYSVSINSYFGSLIGHYDISFWGANGVYLGTYGKNLNSNGPNGALFNPNLPAGFGGVFKENGYLNSSADYYETQYVVDPANFGAMYSRVTQDAAATAAGNGSAYFFPGNVCSDYIVTVAGLGHLEGVNYAIQAPTFASSIVLEGLFPPVPDPLFGPTTTPGVNPLSVAIGQAINAVIQNFTTQLTSNTPAGVSDGVPTSELVSLNSGNSEMRLAVSDVPTGDGLTSPAEQMAGITFASDLGSFDGNSLFASFDSSGDDGNSYSGIDAFWGAGNVGDGFLAQQKVLAYETVNPGTKACDIPGLGGSTK